MGGADVTNVTVTCATNAFSVGGTVTGLVAGSALVLQNNSADEVTVGGERHVHVPAAGRERCVLQRHRQDSAGQSAADLHHRERERHDRQRKRD